MRIGVDIRVLMDKHYSGVAEYTANLLAAILKLDQKNNYKLFYNSWKNLDAKFEVWQKERVEIKASHFPNKLFNYIFQKIFHYPKLDKVLGGVDIFWSPHFNFSSFSKNVSNSNFDGVSKKLKKIITVHDLSFLRYPLFFSFRKNFWHRILEVKTILSEADLIVAVSENTKNDIIELAGIKAEKIKVIYSGNNIQRRQISWDEKKDFLNRHNLGNDFILFLGNIEPRKNISNLILAFNDFRQKNTDSKLKLVLAGAQGWKSKKIYRTQKESPFKADIVFLGYVSKKDREVLYSLARVFVYPSYYEGFGFPPLEAMSAGVPVISSNISSLPEVLGLATISINPAYPQEISQALENILYDADLRKSLIQEGYRQAALFSWEKTAQEYLNLFEKI